MICSAVFLTYAFTMCSTDATTAQRVATLLASRHPPIPAVAFARPQGTGTPPVNELERAEIRKVEAERLKLELEAKEIERRLNAQWWEGGALLRYVIAAIVSTALLFVWVKTYLEPILRRESELTDLAQRRNAAQNSVLEAENARLDKERVQLEAEQRNVAAERDRLANTSQELSNDRDALRSNQQLLRAVVSGLKIAVTQAARKGSEFFSILNAGDPINDLRLHGWKVWSDNYHGSLLGYYLVIQHPLVFAGGEILVGRTMEINTFKTEHPDTWRTEVAKVTRRTPVLVLDYTYFALLVDRNAVVGGELYREDGSVAEFYSPLSTWATELHNALVPPLNAAEPTGPHAGATPEAPQAATA